VDSISGVEVHPSAAKAAIAFLAVFGTTKVVPFQKQVSIGDDLRSTTIKILASIDDDL
jgi:hypothetical protein